MCHDRDMRERIVAVVLVASAGIATGCSSYGSESFDPVDPAEYAADPADNWQVCPLPDLLAQSSHLLDVTITATTTIEMETGPVYGFARRDRAPAPVLADLTDVQTDDVLFGRDDDPRVGVFPSFDASSTLRLISRRNGGAVVELADESDGDVVGRRVIVGTGQYRVGTVEEWPIHLMLHADETGAISFVGPCASEFDRQLQSIVTNMYPDLADGSELDQVIAIMDAALDTDVGGNHLHFARPATARQIGDGLMPSMIAPTLQRIYFVVVPSRAIDGGFGIQSPAGNGSEFFATLDSAEPYTSGALVSTSGPVALAISRHDMSRIADPLDGAFTGSLDGVEALRIDLDADTMTTVITPIALDEIPPLVPFTEPADSLRDWLGMPIVATPGTATIDWVPA
jgi:hypothetical protein